MCGISNSLQLIYSCLVLALVLTVALAQTCERLDPELFPSCVNIGHNQTFKFPSYVDKNRLSAHVKRVIKKNCANGLDTSLVRFDVTSVIVNIGNHSFTSLCGRFVLHFLFTKNVKFF